MNLILNWIYLERIDHLYQSFIENNSELIRLITIYELLFKWAIRLIWGR